MASDLGRRGFLGAAGVAVATGALGADAPATARSVKILGIATSPRKGKTTTAAVQACLDAAKAVNPIVEIELVELAGMNINGAVAAGVPLPAGQEDDFLKLVPVLTDPKVGGIIIGSPVYFGSMSSLCKAFLERWTAFRKLNFPLSGKVAGVVAVGANRNGGQELTIACIQAAMMCHEMLVVGDGKPTAHRGATVWNQGDDITKDEFGLSTAKNLGRRVAEVALLVAGTRG